MIFRTPIGHHLISKSELEKLVEHIDNQDTQKVKNYIAFCINEVNFYEQIRKQSELKKIAKEDGDFEYATQLDKDMRERVKQRVETSKVLKSNFLL